MLEENPDAFTTPQRKGTLKLSESLIYKYLAICIRIQGLQHCPSESEKKRDKLREEYQKATKHFLQTYPGHFVPGVHTMELLFKKLALGKSDEEYLTGQYLLLVNHLGQWVVGDEKLFRFLGKSGYVRYCPNKPDELGIWSYELCGMLENGTPYLLYTRSHTCDTKLGESITCAEVMQQWGQIVMDKGVSVDGKTLLVADSYYLDASGREIMQNQGVAYLCGIQACRFPQFVKVTKEEVTDPGDMALLYNDESQEMFVHRWYPDKKIGQKYILSNAYSKHQGNTEKAYVPGCDDFSLMFSVCDHFNRELHDRTWPFRLPSDLLQLHNFHFSCLLLNVLHIYSVVAKLAPEKICFKDQMLELGDELYSYACTLQNDN